MLSLLMVREHPHNARFLTARGIEVRVGLAPDSATFETRAVSASVQGMTRNFYVYPDKRLAAAAVATGYRKWSF
jgi:hypothetical protein